MQDTEDCSTRAVNLIHFHGLTLLVVENKGIAYLPLKPLSDLAGINWRAALHFACTPEQVEMLGSRWLKPPVIAGSGWQVPPSRAVLFIRMDRARTYLARINTTWVRVRGDVRASEYLHNLSLDLAAAVNHQSQGRAPLSTSTVG